VSILQILYEDYISSISLLITQNVSPLDDGSICIWDISVNAAKKGSIVARSKSGILSYDHGTEDSRSERSKMISPGVTECISIDNILKRAYVAIQNGT
jgi:hypothetical protein